jgi:hypothetical protein
VDPIAILNFPFPVIRHCMGVKIFYALEIKVGEHGQTNLHTDLTRDETQNPWHKSPFLCLKTSSS